MAMTRYGFRVERQSEGFNQKHQRRMAGNEYVLTRKMFREKHK